MDRRAKVYNDYEASGLHAEINLTQHGKRCKCVTVLRCREDGSEVSSCVIWGSVKGALRGTLIDVSVMKVLKKAGLKKNPNYAEWWDAAMKNGLTVRGGQVTIREGAA